jgi:hypothetical protein
MGIIAVSSTVERPTDPLPVLWVIISGLLLLVGTLLIVLPEHLVLLESPIPTGKDQL